MTGGWSPPSPVGLCSLTSCHESYLAIPQVWFPGRLPRGVGFGQRAQQTAGPTCPLAMVGFLWKRGSASTLRPDSVFRLIPGPGPGGVGGGLPGGQGGQAALPEGPGLLGFVETRCSPEVGSPGVAPVRRRPPAARVPRLGLADNGLAGADGGLHKREVQPGGRPVPGARRGRLLQERGLDPELGGRGVLRDLRVPGGGGSGGGGGVDGGVRQGTLGHVVHLGGLRQAFLLHLLQLLLGQAVAEQGRDDLLGGGLEALAAGGVLVRGRRRAPPVGQRDAQVPGAPGAPRRPVPRVREAAARLAQLADVLLVRVLPAAGTVEGVGPGGGAARGGAAQLPPQRDEHGGHNDEQAQGYARDRDDVVGLRRTLGLERRRAGCLESYQKSKNKCMLQDRFLYPGPGSLRDWL